MQAIDTAGFKAGKDKMPDHEADWFGARGEPIGAWAFVKLKNGETKVAMLTKDRIDRIATRSKQAGNYSPKTGKDWEEFWKKAAIRNVSNDLQRLRDALKALGQDKTTDIVVTADHGFSTTSKQSGTSPSAKLTYRDAPAGFLPPGFLAIDLSLAL